MFLINVVVIADVIRNASFDFFAEYAPGMFLRSCSFSQELKQNVDRETVERERKKKNVSLMLRVSFVRKEVLRNSRVIRERQNRFEDEKPGIL